MANPNHRSVLLDHQMIVDGVLMREMKDLTKTLNDETGVEESHLSHMRVIDDRSYTVKHSITDDGAASGEEKEEMIETDMNETELENFKNEWREKWNPSIPEDEPGFLTRFFREDEPGFHSFSCPECWIKMIFFLSILFIFESICKLISETPEVGGHVPPQAFGDQ